MYTTTQNTVMPLIFLPEPDLSLNISPPFINSDYEAKEMGSYNGLALSSSSGSDLSQDNGFFHSEPKLSLGIENVDLMNPHQVVQGLSRKFNHFHNYQPHIHGCNFKRSTRSGVKRSVRAPRMRWTTTLHAHFVHTVQLLGGHESKLMI